MALSDRVTISRRFLQSVRIDTDFGDVDTLEGFVCTPSSANTLRAMVRHISEKRQGAFTWTGPYGSGKSSLAVAFGALLNGNAKLRKQAEQIFPPEVVDDIRKALSRKSKGWQVVPVVGSRDHPVTVIGEAVSQSLKERKPKGDWTDQALVASLKRAADAREYDGVILFIDEMGKFLEGAARQENDIYLFQQLAEHASRSNGRLIIVGVLHQAFGEYASRLSREARDEWAKIQGRFIDLTVNTAGEEQIDLLGRAIDSELPEPKSKRQRDMYRAVAHLVYPQRQVAADSLSVMLRACRPLHPVVTCLLGPISRRRFGQNQRSIFGFLNSAETFGFQDFLRKGKKTDVYTPALLWDYLRANLEPAILASPDGHRWALATEALERCEALGGDAHQLRLLKTIAVIDLFKERSGLTPSRELLLAGLPDFTGSRLDETLQQLSEWSLIILKKFLGAWGIFAGSDFDIDKAVDTAMQNIHQADFVALNELAELQPMLAKRHYHKTGTMRWYDIRLAPASSLDAVISETAADGAFILALATEGEDSQKLQRLCKRASRQEQRDIVVGLPEHSGDIPALARELEALYQVRGNSPELLGDAVARREIDNRIAVLQVRLETELHRMLESARWFLDGQAPETCPLAELNDLASELAELRFDKSPLLHSELLNRQKLSTSAAAARRALIKRMVLNEDEERLGITGFPAEGGLYDSLLQATNLHRCKRGGGDWYFAVPRKGKSTDPCNLAPAWRTATEHVKHHSDRAVAFSEIYDLWRNPPFGIKDGLLNLLAVAFVQSQRQHLAVYREGVFRTGFDDVDADYLAQDPGSIQLRWFNLSIETKEWLSDMADLVRRWNPDHPLMNLAPIDVARGLVAIYEGLPKFTMQTSRLSRETLRIRAEFKRARDPNSFLFDELPEALAGTGALSSFERVAQLTDRISNGLEELVNSYENKLGGLIDLMLRELDVPNASPFALKELQQRAENITEISGDFHLEAFVMRLKTFQGDTDTFEGIASLAASKPPRDWSDANLNQATVNLAELAQKFRRLEQFSRVKGRAAKRHALAITLGFDGEQQPIHEEFDIADRDRKAIENLSDALAGVLKKLSPKRNITLAALARLSVEFISNPPASKRKKKD